MKTLFSWALAGSVGMFAALAQGEQHEQPSGQQQGWLDMQNCTICQPLTEHPELLEEVQWVVRPTRFGAISVFIVPEQHRDLWQTVSAKMKQLEQDFASGKKMPVCGHCKSMNELRQKGANFQEIPTRFGSIVLVTSDQPELIRQIQEHARNTQQAQQQMQQQQQSAEQATSL